jgi:hypothetical protein
MSENTGNEEKVKAYVIVPLSDVNKTMSTFFKMGFSDVGFTVIPAGHGEEVVAMPKPKHAGGRPKGSGRKVEPKFLVDQNELQKQS